MACADGVTTRTTPDDGRRHRLCIRWSGRFRPFNPLGIRQMPSLLLLDELAGLDPRARREMVATLRTVSETFAEVPDGKTASHVVGVLARLLDPS
jgi:hypothetical protein